MKTIKVSKVHAGDVIPAMEPNALLLNGATNAVERSANFPVTVEYFYRIRHRREVHIVGIDAKGTRVDLAVPSQSTVTIEG